MVKKKLDKKLSGVLKELEKSMPGSVRTAREVVKNS